MSAWLFSLIVPLVVGLLWHGLTLKFAVALAGEDSPGFFRAAWVSWMGGLLGALSGGVFSFTIGMVLTVLVGSWLSGALALAITLFTTALVYRKGLGLTTPTALGVTGIHAVLTLMLNSLLGAFVFGMVG